MTKLVKTDSAIVPATSLAGKVEEALAGGSYIEKCRVCGSTEMDDPQAQSFGVCSGECAHRLVEISLSADKVRVDAVGPGIPLTVEPLNPVLRVEGSREIVVDTETDKQALGRMFRPGVPATEISVSSERLGETTRILTSELDPGSDLKIKIPAFADRVSVGPSDIVLYFQDDENTILYSIDAAQNGDSVPIASTATQITVRNYGNRKLSAKLTFRIAQ